MYEFTLIVKHWSKSPGEANGIIKSIQLLLILLTTFG